MGNTSITNVYAIAPELRRYFSNKAQIERVNILNYYDATLYQVIINESTFSYESPASGGDKEAVAAALVAAINAGTDPVTASDNGNGTLNIRANTAGTEFDLVVDSNMSYITLQENKSYDDIVDLILADVARDITATSFGNNQERAQRYLAAHYLTLARDDSNRNPEAGGFLNSETVGSVSYSYGLPALKDVSRLDSTSYGRIYKQIERSHVMPFHVVNPYGE